MEAKEWKHLPDIAENAIPLIPADTENRSLKVASYEAHREFCHPDLISFSWTTFTSNSPDLTRSSSERAPSSSDWSSDNAHIAFSFMEKERIYSFSVWSVRITDMLMSAV